MDIRDGSRSEHVTGSLKYVTLILNNRRTNDGDEHRKNIFFSFHRNAGWLQNMALIDGSKSTNRGRKVETDERVFEQRKANKGFVSIRKIAVVLLYLYCTCQVQSIIVFLEKY